MTAHFVPPGFQKDAFTCPHCNAFAAMEWPFFFLNDQAFNPVRISFCHHCKKLSVWINDERLGGRFMVFPSASFAPQPNPDLPPDCLQDYMEARAIVNKSPRAAAALLRLCVQRLCKHLGCKGKNIDDDIGTLVGQGLPVTIQQALDFVRVVGNNAVHPGTMNLDDQPDTAIALFKLVNMIVDNRITQPKHVAELFGTLPEGAKNAIVKRDGQ